MGKIITICVVVGVVAFVVFLLKGSGEIGKFNLKEQASKMLGDLKKKIKEGRNKPSLYSQPEIYVKMPEDSKYRPAIKMKKEVFTVGKKDADLCIDLDYFADTQFKITHVKEGTIEYFTLMNLGKVNRTEFLHGKNYYFMDYKDELELRGVEKFYVGGVKFKIEVPLTKREARGSDLDREEDRTSNKQASDRPMTDDYSNLDSI